MFPVVVTPSSLEFSCPSFVFCNSYFSFCNHIFGSVVIVFLTKFDFVPLFLYSFIFLIYSHFLPLNSPCLEFCYIIDIWCNSEWFRTILSSFISMFVWCVCCPSISGNVRTIRSNSVKYCSHYYLFVQRKGHNSVCINVFHNKELIYIFERAIFVPFFGLLYSWMISCTDFKWFPKR